MELEALLTSERTRPVVLVGSIKAEREQPRAFLDERGYKAVEAGMLASGVNFPAGQSLMLIAEKGR